jgi:DNA-binding beta-propeller fold protein YncE
MKNLIACLITFVVLFSCHSETKKQSRDTDHAKPNPDAPYKVLKKIKIPGDGGWDYAAFDTVNRRLYVSHSTKVNILDVDKEQVVGEIPNTPGVHGIAFAYDLNKGYTSNGKDSSVTIFDLKTMKTIKKVKITGANPDAILYDAFSKTVFTFNGHSDDLTAIDAETGAVKGTLALGGKPEFSVTNESGRIYVNLEDKDEILDIDPKKLEIRNRYKIDSGSEPSGLAFDLTYHRLFIGCGNKILDIKNSDNGGKTIVRPIGDGVDAVAFNQQTRVIFSSNGEGTLTIIRQFSDGDHYTQSVNINTQKGARTMAIDTKNNRVYLPVADYGPPAPAEPGKKSRPSIVPGSFGVLVVGQ